MAEGIIINKKMFNISPAQPKRASQSEVHTRRLKKISQYAQILLYQERACTLVRAHKRESAINNVQININEQFKNFYYGKK